MTHWQQVNFLDELNKMGHNVQIVDVGYFELTDSILNKLKVCFASFKPALFMTACDDKVLNSSIFDEIYKNSTPSLLICFDNLSVPFKHKKCSQYFDLVWLTSIETKYLFDKWGARTIFLPYAANPDYYLPVNGAEKNIVSFVGTCYGVRRKKIETLLDHGIPVELHGGNDLANEQVNPAANAVKNLRSSIERTYDLCTFPIGRKALYGALIKSISRDSGQFSKEFGLLLQARKSLSFSEMSEMYSRSSISLGVSELWNTYYLKEPVHKVHLRSFEIPMSGGLQLASKTNEMLSYFEEDNEAIYYTTKEEMVDKVRFYLKDNNYKLREKIKLRARKRAEECHTWKHRFQFVFNELQLI